MTTRNYREIFTRGFIWSRIRELFHTHNNSSSKKQMIHFHLHRNIYLDLSQDWNSNESCGENWYSIKYEIIAQLSYQSIKNLVLIRKTICIFMKTKYTVNLIKFKFTELLGEKNRDCLRLFCRLSCSSSCSIFDHYELLSLSRDFKSKSRGTPRIQYFAVRVKLSRTLLLFALQPCWCSTCPPSRERKSPSASRPFSLWQCSWWPFAKLCRPRRRRRW